MEIRVKTYDEISSERVRIEVAPGQRATIEIVDGEVSTGLASRRYTAEEVGDLQASEAELVAAPLRREVAEMKAKLDRVYADLDRSMDATEKAKSRVAELEEENQRLARQVCEFDRDRRTEQRRADENKAWAGRAEGNGARLSEALVQAEKDRDNARRRVAELERSLALSIGRENKLESDAAEEATLHRQSLAARDQLLRAATTRLGAAREILLATAVSRARDEIVTSKGAVLADAIGNALHALEG